MTKKSYRVRNWSEYNKALTQRGSLALWIAPEIEDKWYEKKVEPAKRKRGRQKIYSDFAIETCTTLRVLFDLAFRQGKGFAQSVFDLMHLALIVPSASQQCRRLKTLEIALKYTVTGRIHVVVDATGLKIFGEGEWKVRQHSYSKRRMWRKLHIGVDVKTQEIVIMELTDNHIGENKLLPSLLEQYEDGYTTVGGDKGYDSYDCHETVGAYAATSAIAIQRKSKIRKRLCKDEPPLIRDNIVRRMREIGRTGWKKEVNYHQRSLVETAFFRYKTLFGDRMHSHLLENQKVEALIACNILNRFTQQGMPVSVPIN